MLMERIRNKLITASLIGSLLIVLMACGGSSETETTTTTVQTNDKSQKLVSEESQPADEVSKTIVDIAVEDERFTTLVVALQAAELDSVLTGSGPFTVFAPTDSAFGKLPEGTVESLLADIPALKDILLYHVVSGDVLAADVLNLESAETLQGDSFSISTEDGKVMVNDAEVIITDITASNGIIHVLDTVLLPPADEAS
jgi:uncharacterized surface protein with fasciclin (FAS1) repeats